MSLRHLLPYLILLSTAAAQERPVTGEWCPAPAVDLAGFTKAADTTHAVEFLVPPGYYRKYWTSVNMPEGWNASDWLRRNDVGSGIAVSFAPALSDSARQRNRLRLKRESQECSLQTESGVARVLFHRPDMVSPGDSLPYLMDAEWPIDGKSSLYFRARANTEAVRNEQIAAARSLRFTPSKRP